MTPTQRTLKRLRADGYTATVVEHWNPFSRSRHDLFGFIDILAIGPGMTLGVQSTTGAHISDRLRKARVLPELKAWLEAGNIFQVWGWRKGKRGDGALRRVEMCLAQDTIETKDVNSDSPD